MVDTIIQILALVGSLMIALYSLMLKLPNRTKIRKRLIWLLVPISILIFIFGVDDYYSNIRLNNKLTIDSLNIIANNLKKETEKMIINDELSSETFQKNRIGYAFYGILNYDSTWSERYFILNSSYNKEVIPKPGDIAKCISDVNVRKGYIEYLDGMGWKNKPPIGYVIKNDLVRIIEVNAIFNTFIWIKFQKI